MFNLSGWKWGICSFISAVERPGLWHIYNRNVVTNTWDNVHKSSIKEISRSGETQKLHGKDMTPTKQAKNSIILSNWWNSKNFIWNNQVKTFSPINQEKGILNSGINSQFMVTIETTLLSWLVLLRDAFPYQLVSKNYPKNIPTF